MGIVSKTRMYNPGERIVDTLTYTLEDGHDPHCVARWVLDAPANDFFAIPEVLQVRDMRISVHFVETVLMRYASRGVVAIDANYQPLDDEQEAIRPYAQDDATAAAKGQARWKDYYMEAARAHVEQCQNCRAANMPPIAASGFTKRALQLAGLSDPADAFILAAQKKTDDISELKEQLNRQQAMIDQLLANAGNAPIPQNHKTTGNGRKAKEPTAA